jgi:hypothetical protein
LVLFLGAGVSKGSSIPGWKHLARNVFDELKIVGVDYDTFRCAFPNWVTQFDLAAHKLKSQTQFVRMLYHCLYGDPKFKEIRDILKGIPRSGQCTWPRWKDVVGKLEQNKTLRAVGELLLLQSEGEWRRNPQIHAVLTTNADNLLEVYCQARASGRRPLTMVDRASVGDHPEKTPVYHLHGMLDARCENVMRVPSPCEKVLRDLQEIDKGLLPSLVFRESEYYDTLASPTGFVNHIPQSYFQRLNVLFVGTSLDDLNIRRWLYTSFKERVGERTKYLREYYCRKYCDAEFEAEKESVRHFWLRSRYEKDEKGKERKISNELKELVELVMGKLGVQLVWCDSYHELRDRLRELKEEGREPDFGHRRLSLFDC